MPCCRCGRCSPAPRFYDSLIVAAALEAGCTRLLSEDLQHGQQIEGLTIENPFGP